MKQATWTTRDGREVRIRAMADSHLSNTIAYLRRNAEVVRLNNYCAALQYAEHAPDGAADAAEQGAEELMDMDTDDVLRYCVPQYPALVREAKRRGLA